jgi:hypothetical protein
MSNPPDLSPPLLLFFSFLTAAFDMEKADFTPRTSTQEKIAKDRDFYLPFRQLAPSKQIVLDDPEGPFSPTRLRTREGFFDALIFRLITQASPILLQEKQVCFGSLARFQSAIEGKDQLHYCRPKATGRHNRINNISHVPNYWENSADWSNHWINNTGVTLDSLLLWLVGNKDGKKRFFGMGNLVGWLLASDYAYAGLVNMPDASEVGKTIFKINAGGKDGLALLGFDVDTPEACSKAMNKIWNAICSNFSSVEIEEMGLDAITIEHALCKFKRLYRDIESVSCNPSFCKP